MTTNGNRQRELTAMEKVLDGDEGAYRQMLVDNFPRLYGLCAAYAGDAEVGRDALVAAAVLGPARAAVFDGDKSFLGWMGDHALRECRAKLGREPEVVTSDKYAAADHETPYDNMVGLALGELDETVRAMIEEHTRSCDMCAAELELVSRAVGASAARGSEAADFDGLWAEVKAGL